MDSDDEEETKKSKGPKFPIQMYISEGNKYLRLGKYDTAIEFFNSAIEREPNNERSLTGRAKCYMRLAKYNEARRDAEEILKTHPKSCDAKMLVGEADYFLGDFEKAFLTFHRGHMTRLNHDGLRCGHQMCRKAIDNALKPDVPFLIDVEDIDDIQKIKDEPPISKHAKDFSTPDLNFVNTLLEDQDIDSIHSDCEYVKEYLQNRQEFWRTQNPNALKRTIKDTDIAEEGKSSKNINNYPKFFSGTKKVLSGGKSSNNAGVAKDGNSSQLSNEGTSNEDENSSQQSMKENTNEDNSCQQNTQENTNEDDNSSQHSMKENTNEEDSDSSSQQGVQGTI